MEAIRNYLATFATTQTSYIIPDHPQHDTTSWKPLLKHWQRVITKNPNIRNNTAPIFNLSTKSLLTTIEATITRLHFALIYRASAMQRVITALVRNRQNSSDAKSLKMTSSASQKSRSSGSLSLMALKPMRSSTNLKRKSQRLIKT